MREAIANIQTESKPKVDQSKSKGQLSLLEQPKPDIQESSPEVNKSSPNSENSKTVQVVDPDRIECSERKMSDLTGITRHALKQHREDNPLGTPLPAQINKKPYNIMCVEAAGVARSTNKWVGEPI